MDSDRFLAAIIESSHDCIVGMKPDGTILCWNKAAEKIFGLKESEAIGRDARVLDDFLADLKVESFLEMVRRGAVIDHYEACKIDSQGMEILLALSFAPVKTRFGEVIGISLIARDITDSKNARLMEQQIELHKQREDFVAALTHDLKNPIVGCYRILELISQNKIANQEEQGDLIKKVLSSHKEMLEIMNDLLSVFRYQRLSSYSGSDVVDFSDLVKDAISLVEPAAISKKIQIESSVAGSLFTLGESGPLKRVVSNLLDNAVNFSPEGSTVEVYLVDNGSKILLSVTDRGTGIPEEEQSNLFHQFWQGRSGKSNSMGSGLGLYLGRQIIEAHEGRILCSSSANAGTTFTVELPKAYPEFAICSDGMAG